MATNSINPANNRKYQKVPFGGGVRNPIRVNRYSESDSLVTSRKTIELSGRPLDRFLLGKTKRSHISFFAGNPLSSQEGRLQDGDPLLNNERETQRSPQIERVYLDDGFLSYPRDQYNLLFLTQSVTGNKRLSFRITVESRSLRMRKFEKVLVPFFRVG